MSKLPILPPEIIAQIMGYVSHNREKPLYLGELRVLRREYHIPFVEARNKYVFATNLYVLNMDFRHHFRDVISREFIDQVREKSKKESSNSAFCMLKDKIYSNATTKTFFKKIYKVHRRLDSHRLRILRDEGLYDPILHELPFATVSNEELDYYT